MVTPKVGFELGADLAHIQFISKARYFGQSNAEQKVFQHAVCITRRLYFLSEQRILLFGESRDPENPMGLMAPASHGAPVGP